MRPFIGMIFLLLIINHLQVTAQNQDYFCGWSDKIPDTYNSLEGNCFNVQNVFDSCKPVYVRINLHFFVNDNCEGQVQQMGKNQMDIYKIAEEMINAANNTYAYNEAQWQMPDSIVPCNPIRLVLKGIYTHCKSKAVGIYNTNDLNNEFGVHTSTEINFYIADSEDGATGVGYHYQRCGSAVLFNKENWWTIGNFVHELGHILTLAHSFEADGCTDTPIITYDWDKNCDGVLEDSNNRQLDETDLTCWNQYDSNKNPGQAGYSDINHNNVNDCDEQAPCTPWPCCLKENQDNNVMSYSAAKSALTKCQILKMLSDLSGFNCGLIEKIGDCPPASSFITQTPEDLKDQSRCKECLILEASVNDEEFKLKIYEQVNNREILVYDGGWKTGPATNYCFRTGSAFKGLSNYLKPNTHYIAYLKTRNSCSENEYDYKFITNSADCSSLPYESLIIRPNPVINQIIVEFIVTDSNENIQAIAKNMITGAPHILLQNQIAGIGTNQMMIDISGLQQGSYTLLLLGEHTLYQNNFVKI